MQSLTSLFIVLPASTLSVSAPSTYILHLTAEGNNWHSLRESSKDTRKLEKASTEGKFIHQRIAVIFLTSITLDVQLCGCFVCQGARVAFPRWNAATYRIWVCIFFESSSVWLLEVWPCDRAQGCLTAARSCLCFWRRFLNGTVVSPRTQTDTPRTHVHAHARTVARLFSTVVFFFLC